MECPAQWSSGAGTQDTEIGGVPIPKDASVLIIWASGSRDDPLRRPRALLDRAPECGEAPSAFGNGRHTCVGAPLARLLGRASFDVILTRLTNLRLREEHPQAIESIAFRGPKSVPISFDPA